MNFLSSEAQEQAVAGVGAADSTTKTYPPQQQLSRQGQSETPFHSTPSSDLFVDPALASSAARSAIRSAFRTTDASAVYDSHADADLPRIGRDELVLGELLGEGGFNDVYEVRDICLNTLRSGESLSMFDELDGSGRLDGKLIGRDTNHTASTTGSETDDSKQNGSAGGDRQRWNGLDRGELARRFLARHCLRPSKLSDISRINSDGYDARYAIKHLSLNTLSDPRSYKTGAADLAVEAKLLSSLSHPNLIRIRGVASAGLAGFATGRRDSFFLILDRLYDTLDSLLDEWRDKSLRLNSIMRRKFLDKSGKKRRAFLAQRMRVALDVASAMCYLHSKGVIYRDLKPDNVGLDIRGDVKIFDLGLAKELRPASAYQDGTYNLSGNTGSLRYMSPEVALCKPYNRSADVYSFSLLLHEIMSLKTPYQGMSRRLHADNVVRGSVRPSVDPSWPSRTKCSLQRGWDATWYARPTMRDWYRVLRRDIAVLDKRHEQDGLPMEEDPLMGGARRRSTYVMPAPLDLGEKSSYLCPIPLPRVVRRNSSSSSSSGSNVNTCGCKNKVAASTRGTSSTVPPVCPVAGRQQKIIDEVDGGTVESSAVVAAAASLKYRRMTRGALAA